MEGFRFQAATVRRPNLRTAFPRDFAARLRGQTVRSVSRRGKYLLAELSSNEVLVMHLGMSGSFEIHDRHQAVQLGTHDHVVFCMSSGATIVFNDPRRFGFMTLLARDDRHVTISALGPEPLAPEFDAAALARACAGKKTSLKVALLDQRVVAGIGNIYACEALHRARLSPRRRASTIATRSGGPRRPAHALAVAIKKVLSDAINHRHLSFSRFRVYDREGAACPHRDCTGTIRRVVQAGRATFFCPNCQR